MSFSQLPARGAFKKRRAAPKKRGASTRSSAVFKGRRLSGRASFKRATVAQKRREGFLRFAEDLQGVGKRAGPRAAPIKIPECTQSWFAGLYDPWMVPQGVCIPTANFPLPSQKVKCFLRGQFALGTTGFGYVVMTPTTTNDGACLTMTSSLSVGGAGTALNVFDNLNSIACGDLPYDTAQIFTNQVVSARVACVGVRIRYAGRSDQRSGIYTSLESPDHINLFTTIFQDIQQQYMNATTTRPSPNADWDAAITYTGATAPHHVDFTNLANPISPTPVGGGSPFAITCQGLAGDIIEFEYAIHNEYIGRAVAGRSESHSDPATYGHALRQSKADAGKGSLSKQKLIPGFKSFLGSVWDTLPSIGGLATAAITSVVTENPIPLLVELASEVGQALTAPATPRRGGTALGAASRALGI